MYSPITSYNEYDSHFSRLNFDVLFDEICRQKVIESKDGFIGEWQGQILGVNYYTGISRRIVYYKEFLLGIPIISRGVASSLVEEALHE